MTCHRFDLEHQLAFSELSGDCNPLHTDAVAARRLLFGSTVVHGVHSTLWALDNWLSDKTENIELRSINAAFRNPIRIDEEVIYSVKNESDGHVEIELTVGGSVAASLDINWGRSKGCDADCFSKGFPKLDECIELSEDEVEKASGSLELYLDLEASALLFQHLTALLPPLQIAQLLATTRLVGMMCPGLHSLYSMLDLGFEHETGESSSLTYEVAKMDKRFGKVLMKISSPRMAGTVTAFYRPPPKEQISFADVHGQVEPNEFAGQRALVVGGSRGLGEVTAKLLSAGGADVRITYNQGVEDSRRIVDDIVSGGGCADCLSLNVLDAQMEPGNRLGGDWTPTHLYYFATPFIAIGRKGSFSAALFQEFCDYYVIGFERVVEQLGPLGLRGIFYPSSVFIDELPSDMGEYVAAKMAGEALCAFMEKTHQDIAIHKPRLPRMATDQTASLLPLKNEDAVSILLEHLRILRDSSISPEEK